MLDKAIRNTKLLLRIKKFDTRLKQWEQLLIFMNRLEEKKTHREKDAQSMYVAQCQVFL
jgi:hypothetical protein